MIPMFGSRPHGLSVSVACGRAAAITASMATALWPEQHFTRVVVKAFNTCPCGPLLLPARLCKA